MIEQAVLQLIEAKRTCKYKEPVIHCNCKGGRGKLFCWRLAALKESAH